MTLPTISYTSSIIIAAPLNWLIDRIPGLNKVNFSIKGVQKYLGVFGDPMMLGFILGCAMGALAMFPFDQIFLTGINVAAVMVLMPKMTAMFVEGLMPISSPLRSSQARSLAAAPFPLVWMLPLLSATPRSSPPHSS